MSTQKTESNETDFGEDMDFYFWLGADGLNPVSEQEFKADITKYRKILDDYYECPKST